MTLPFITTTDRDTRIDLACRERQMMSMNRTCQSRFFFCLCGRVDVVPTRPRLTPSALFWAAKKREFDIKKCQDIVQIGFSSVRARFSSGYQLES